MRAIIAICLVLAGCNVTPEQQRAISEALQDAGRQVGETAEARKGPVECEVRYGRVTCPR